MTDGCNWGDRPLNSSRLANRTFGQYMVSFFYIFHLSFSPTTEQFIQVIYLVDIFIVNILFYFSWNTQENFFQHEVWGNTF